MTWKTVRLELAGTAVFPHGSAGRSYLLNLPLDEIGEIDAMEVSRNPHRATFRRFWPSEPDEIGQVVPLNGGWVLCCDKANNRKIRFKLATSAFRLNDEVAISDEGGRELPFRVANISGLGRKPLQ